MKFTAPQTKAIKHTKGNLQPVACAGSGKTEVVARRVVSLLGSGVEPAGIVAFTYTNKAAGELKERITARCHEAGIVYGLAEMYVGSMHAFCLELLRREVPKFLKFDLLNEIQQLLFINRCSTKSGLTKSTDLNGFALRRYVDTGHYLAAANILRESATVAKALANCSVANGLNGYSALLEEKNYFDYSSVMEEAINALGKDQALRRRLKESLRYVIVDEYQDINPIQEKIVELLHGLGAKICVVGDDDQTIYQWRGSNVQNILSFQGRYPNVTQVRLEENFRSSEGIIKTARAFIEQNQERLPKAMQPANAQDYTSGALSHFLLKIRKPKPSTSHKISRRCTAWRSRMSRIQGKCVVLPILTWRSFCAA
jgi:DNA helicase II / ATP-dependent DNA helicase PcrA